jgi:HlyD family secretion protein
MAMVTFKEWPENVTRNAPLIITGVVALAIGIVGTRLTMGNQPAPSAAATTTATAPVIKTVSALGRLEPDGTIISVSANSGVEGARIEALQVKEGDRVKKGDVIAILNSEKRLKATLQQTQEQVRVAQAKLAQVKSGAKSGEIEAQRSEIARLNAERTGDYNTQSAIVARLNAELEGVKNTQAATRERLIADYNNAMVEADRYEQLFKAGATSASLRDSKRLVAQTAYRRGQEAASEAERVRNTLAQQITEANAALERSQNARSEQVAAADSTLDRIAEVRPVDIQAAEAEIAQVRAAVAKAEADLEQAYVIAPQDGVVLKIYTYAGEKIAAEGVIDLGRTQQMTALVEVYESDVQRIKLGQPVTVISDAIAAELRGNVSAIGNKVLRQNVVNTDPTANTDSRVMEVRINLDAESSQKSAQFTNSQVTAKIELN